MKKYKGNGHWLSERPINSGDNFGFLYQITCIVTGRRYVGKKQFHVYRKRKQVRESDWRAYTSSSEELNRDIRHLGKGHFRFEILKVFKTRGWLGYAEANYQHKMNVMTARFPDGERVYYNKSILQCRHVPDPAVHPSECPVIERA